MEAQDSQDGGTVESQDNVGASENEPQEAEASDGGQTQDPLYVQKRLKQQKRAHEREIRDLHQRIDHMQSMGNAQQSEQPQNPYAGNSMDEQIHKAVSMALNHRDMEERKAKEQQSTMHLHKQYGELQKHLDSTSDKYDDFEDVVRGEDSPFTPHMRDAALLLPKKGAGSAGEVLYKLGKNPEDLHRIAKLHPIDQASEMIKLSHALINGGDSKGSEIRSLGNIKSNPVSNSHSITEKTSVSDLRKKMRAGWK